MLKQRYVENSGIAIEPILGDIARFGVFRMEDLLRFFSQRGIPIDISERGFFTIRTKSFASIAVDYLYSNRGGWEKIFRSNRTSQASKTAWRIIALSPGRGW